MELDSAGQTYPIAVSGSSREGTVELALATSDPEDYETWSARFFPAGSPDAQRSADPNLDDLENLQGDAFARDLNVHSGGAPLAGFPQLPNGSSHLSYWQPRSATDLIHLYEFSNDLQTRHAATGTESLAPLDPLVEEVSVRLDYRLQRKPGLFIRIVVRPPPL